MQMYILINQTMRFIHLITQKSNEFIKYNYGRMRIENYPLNWNECTIKTDFKDISEILLFKKSNKFERPINLMVTHYSPLNLCLSVRACVNFLCSYTQKNKHTYFDYLLQTHSTGPLSPSFLYQANVFTFFSLSDENLFFCFFFLFLSFT